MFICGSDHFVFLGQLNINLKLFFSTMIQDINEQRDRVNALLYYDACITYLSDLTTINLEQLVTSTIGQRTRTQYPKHLSDEHVIKCML